MPYCYYAVNGGPHYCKLIATATYATPAGRHAITMKRFDVGQADGSLAVDDAFGISGNGAMDQVAPDQACSGGANCSWSVAQATACARMPMRRRSGIALDGNRLAFSGTEYFGALPDPLFTIVRVSDGALTGFRRGGFNPLRANETLWGDATFTHAVAAGASHFATTGYLYDASANNAMLFGTARFASDRIFADGFDAP